MPCGAEAEHAPSAEAEAYSSCPGVLRADEPGTFENLGRPGVFAVAFEEVGKIELAPAGLVEDDVYVGDLTSETSDVCPMLGDDTFLQQIGDMCLET